MRENKELCCRGSIHCVLEMDDRHRSCHPLCDDFLPLTEVWSWTYIAWTWNALANSKDYDEGQLHLSRIWIFWALTWYHQNCIPWMRFCRKKGTLTEFLCPFNLFRMAFCLLTYETSQHFQLYLIILIKFYVDYFSNELISSRLNFA